MCVHIMSYARETNYSIPIDIVLSTVTQLVYKVHVFWHDICQGLIENGRPIGIKVHTEG